MGKTKIYRKNCAICGKPFEAHDYRTRTCSRSCAHSLGLKKPKEPEVRNRSVLQINAEAEGTENLMVSMWRIST